MYDEYLLQVQKPARYIGNEWNVSRKDFKSAGIKFALCFPDLYEVGMSNLGIRILYSLLNDIPDVCCERFFAPAGDLESILRTNHLELLSLESRKPLKEFDIIGFSLGYELSYTNVLNILDLGKIPLEAQERGADYPLVIAGGPCVCNPEPMHAFFDLFVIGEAEEAIKEITELYRKNKQGIKAGKLSKEELLIKLSEIPGVYVPSLYQAEYDRDGSLKKFEPRFKDLKAKITKRYIRDLAGDAPNSKWLVPYIQIIHDRITLELTRGCPNSCRFCQARSVYFPLRKVDAQDVIRNACEAYRSSGYEEISLSGLSVGDYPGIEGLLEKLIELFKDKKVSISLPSIKPRLLLGKLASLIATIKKTGLTFAPEVGSEKLRKVISKNFKEDEYYDMLLKAYSSGYQRVKLYFMIGLPQEEMEDLDKIIEIVKKTSQLRRQVSRSPAQVTLSINTLIPKPHTSFQWFGMEKEENIRAKQDYLRSKLRDKRIKLDFHNPEVSFLEGVLSRGDRRLSAVIRAAFGKGARFDGWYEHFQIDRWQESFRQQEIDPFLFLGPKSKTALLPWDFLEMGIARDKLLSDHNKIIV